MVQRISSPVLVGRAAELARLAAALERAASGAPATVLVAGEAGVGKTRLLAEHGRRAEAAGATVLVGGCLDVGDGTLPYAPVVEALRSLVATADPAALDELVGAARPELSRLVPELGGPAPPPAGVTPPSRLFELLLGVLHRLAARGPVLLVVEDLHWADRSTRDLLGFLVRNLRGGVALVLSYRSDELHRRHPLRPFLAELERGRRVERLELGRLRRLELADLLAGILDHRPAARQVREVFARSQGNPFYAEELLAAAPDGAGLPPAVRDLLLARVEALPEEAQRVLRVAAAAGSRVDHELLAAVAGVPDRRLLELLREAVNRHLLASDQAGGAYRFRHALVQEVLYDDLLPGERATLHAAYAAALSARTGERAGLAELGQLAYHWSAAHDLGPALLASVRAGLAAEAVSALAEAEGHYGRALELWSQAPEAAATSPLDRPDLLQRAANAAMLSGQTDRAVALARQALAAVDPAAEPLRAGAALERLARYQWMNGDSDSAIATLEEAVAVIPSQPPSRELARALAAQGQLLMLRARNAMAAARCEQAISVARQAGARAEEGHARNSLGIAMTTFGQVDEGIAHLRAARRIAEELGDPEDIGRADYNLTGTLLAAGRTEEALAMALASRETAERLGAGGLYGSGGLHHAADALILLGRWEEAERLLSDELDLEPPGQRPVQPVFVHGLQARGLLRLWRGDTAAARANLEAVLAGERRLDPQFAAPLYARRARIASWEGQLDEARASVAEGLALLAGTDDLQLLTRVYLAGIEAEAARAETARARRSAEQLDDARQVARRLLEGIRAAAAGRVAIGSAAADLLTAEAEWSRVEGTSDPLRWGTAALAWDDLGFPFPAAYAHFRQADALLAAGASRAEAGAVLRRAWAVASGLGAGWLESEIGALARRGRIELEPARPEEPEASPPSPGAELGLTAREREVLALLADGRTNRQIAGTLYITHKTASTHVSHILAKLGVSNRSEAAAVAHRLGLAD
jgi:DNA-binding CsgD family transcriptional regulator/tetratricopeptide (TPR) repeat protein